MKKFTQKIYYGYEEDSSFMSVPCPYEPHRKVGSEKCRRCMRCEGGDMENSYIICSRKPELLEALEEVCRDLLRAFPEERHWKTPSIAKAKSAMEKAYGESNE